LGIMVSVRRSRGKDIDAACGQLANKGWKKNQLYKLYFESLKNEKHPSITI
jgi:hypothetical protein